MKTVIFIPIAILSVMFTRPSEAATFNRLTRESNDFVTSVIGKTTVLPCHPQNPPVMWFYRPDGGVLSKEYKTVVESGEPQNGYAARFSLNVTETGNHDLIIRNTSFSDQGMYRCVDDNGLGSRLFVQLSVRNAESDTKCKTFKSIPAVASAGDRVSLPCCISDISNVLWRFGDSVIAENGYIANDFSDRFSFGNTRESYHSLIISDSRRSDTGVYVCVETNGNRRSQNISVIVTELTTTIRGSSLDNADHTCNTAWIMFALSTMALTAVSTALAFKIWIHFHLLPKQRSSASTASHTEEGDPLLGSAGVADTLVCPKQQMSLVKTIADETDDVCHFGELNEILYIVHRSGHIKAYKMSDNSFKHQPDNDIKLGVRYSPAGFAPNKSNNRLYIGNRIDRNITFIDLNALNAKENSVIPQGFIKFNEDSETSQRLSTAPDGKLVVLVAIENHFSRTWYGRIDIYDEFAERRMSIRIPESAINPWCATYMGDKTFTITYGLSEFGLMQLSMDGTPIKKRKLGALSVPRSLKHFAGTECVYVLDSGRRKLLELDMNLEIKNVLYDWSSCEKNENNDSTQPMRMLLNAQKTHMLVGMQSGRVNLYKIKWKIDENGSELASPFD